MKKLLFAIVVTSAFAASAAPPKLAPPPPVCIVYDTSDTLVDYGTGGTSADQTLQKFSGRLNRYVVKYLTDVKVTVSSLPCILGTDATLTIKYDSLSPVAKRKFFGGAATHANLKYFVIFASPQGAVLLNKEEETSDEGLDALAENVANEIKQFVQSFY
jgi:hypothetical protein